MKIRVVNKLRHELPDYSTVLSAGMYIRANIDEKIILKPMERCTGGFGHTGKE